MSEKHALVTYHRSSFCLDMLLLTPVTPLCCEPILGADPAESRPAFFCLLVLRFPSTPGPWTGPLHHHTSSANIRLAIGISGRELKEITRQFIPRSWSMELIWYISSCRTLTTASWCRWRRQCRPFWGKDLKTLLGEALQGMACWTADHMIRTFLSVLKH